MSARESLVAARANPHQSQAAEYEVEVIEEAEGEVCVRYLHKSDVDPWWITRSAWLDWEKWTS